MMVLLAVQLRSGLTMNNFYNNLHEREKKLLIIATVSIIFLTIFIVVKALYSDYKISSKNLIKEKIVLEKLSKQGIPVPDVISFGKDYLILSDVGDAIINIIERRHSYYSNSHPKFHLNGAPSKEKILTKASIALAKLHKMGYAHGRPSIKDIRMKNNKIYCMLFFV